MKNVTITLPEELAAWLRVEAAKAGKSVSTYLRDVVEATRGEADRDRARMEALGAFLDGPLFHLSGPTGRLEPVGEDYDADLDERFRRHERAGLHAGQGRAGQTDRLRSVAEGTGSQARFEAKPPKPE